MVEVITCKSNEFITRGLWPLVINSLLLLVITSTTCDNIHYFLPATWESPIPMKYWNCFANILLSSFCCYFVNSSELSQLFKAVSSDEFTKEQQNDNKKIFAKQFQYFIGMIITAKYWNHSDYEP